MSFRPDQVTAICALNAPVLFLDTCMLLDVVRDVTRESVTSQNLSACLALLALVETRTDLVVCLATQVKSELNDNLSGVEDDSRAKLTKYVSEALRIDQAARLFGATGAMNTGHLFDHVARARKAMDRWLPVAHEASSEGDIPGRAWRRVSLGIAPAKKGKESMKDCVVIETYFEAADQLRKAGLSTPFVFASSNTKEYHEPNTSHLTPDLQSQFTLMGMEYAPNYGSAKHHLRL